MNLRPEVMIMVGAGLVVLGQIGNFMSKQNTDATEFAIRCDERGGPVYVSEYLPQEQTCLMFTGNNAVVLMREPL